MTPAGRLVYMALEGSVHDQESLAAATGLSKRRIRDVVGDLVDMGIVTSYRMPSDQRRRIYYDPEAFDLVEAQHRYANKQAEN